MSRKFDNEICKDFSRTYRKNFVQVSTFVEHAFNDENIDYYFVGFRVNCGGYQILKKVLFFDYRHFFSFEVAINNLQKLTLDLIKQEIQSEMDLATKHLDTKADRVATKYELNQLYVQQDYQWNEFVSWLRKNKELIYQVGYNFTND
ncbi:MAG: hypothetical protein ACRCXZ_03510 [Patescibacteria group bacterium]